MALSDGRREVLLKQYEIHVDLYKFYADATIKLSAFHYAITGALLSFYFTRADIGPAKYSLVLPFVLSIGLAGIFWNGARLLGIVRKDVFELCDKLELGVAPEFKVLSNLLRFLAVVLAATGLSILALAILR